MDGLRAQDDRVQKADPYLVRLGFQMADRKLLWNLSIVGYICYIGCVAANCSLTFSDASICSSCGCAKWCSRTYGCG